MGSWGGDILTGALLGILAGVFGGYVMLRVVRLLGQSGPSERGVWLVIVGMLVKLPLIFGIAYLSYLLSIRGLYAFACAITVVYFALIWRASRGGLF